jgi:proteasome activator subunit 4
MPPDLSSLHTNEGHSKPPCTTTAPIPDDIEDTKGDRYMDKLKEYARSIPYAIEPYSKAIELLDFFILRLTQSVEAQDFDIGFMQWATMLT